jgi:prophage regulatory protein
VTRLLRLPQVTQLTGLGPTDIYQQIKHGTFPPSVPLGSGGRAVGWVDTEIRQWIQQRIAQRHLSPRKKAGPGRGNRGPMQRARTRRQEAGA